MVEKSKKEQKIKEENIKKLDEKIKEDKIISFEYKKKMNKQTISNLVTVLMMVIYLVSLNAAALYTDSNIYINLLKCLSIALAGISIVYFELGYRKDNEKLFLYGVEVLILALITLFSNYGYYIYFNNFNKILMYITIGIVIYYIIKILVIRSSMKKKYYNDKNDIKDIIGG